MKSKLSAHGPSLSEIVAGVMKWGQWGANLSTREMAKLIAQCEETGVTSFDHADIYGGYTTEKEFGKALKESQVKRESIELITKCGICYPCDERPEFATKSYNTSRDYILKAVDLSLSNLQTEYIDLLLIHRPSPIMDYREMADTFMYLKETGKIRYAGVSNFTSYQFESFNHFHPLVTNQLEASVLHLDAFLDGTLDTCQKFGIKPMAWSPMGGGELFGNLSDYKKQMRRSRIVSCSKEWDIPPDQLALAFLLHHPAGILPVLGTSKIERIKIAVAAREIHLTDEQWFEIWTASTGEKVP